MYSHHGHGFVVFSQACGEIIYKLTGDVHERRIGQVELVCKAVQVGSRGVGDIERERGFGC